jgi:hypothetical protein
MMKARPVYISLLVIFLFSNCLFEVDAQTKTKRRRAARISSAAVRTPSGLTYLITQKGAGRRPRTGETVIVHYTGTLTNGVKFDSSRDRKEPFAFKLGGGQVIKGWDEGFAKMRVGDRAIFVIPPKLGYGSRGSDDVIPPNSTLIFIVELVDIKAKSLSDVMLKTLTDNYQRALTVDPMIESAMEALKKLTGQ